jgi:transcriptional regulator with XRE-family HTH domain
MKNINDLDFEIPKEIENYTAHSTEIAIMISNYIRSVKGMNKKTFAKLVGKTASDVTRWVSGNHNFTIITLSLIEARTGIPIIKRLSSDNIKDNIDCKVFKIETEEDLKLEIHNLKAKIKELENKNEHISLRENVWGNFKTYGVYESKNIHDFILTGSEVSTFKLRTEEPFKIRSKGNELPVRRPKLVNID